MSEPIAPAGHERTDASARGILWVAVGLVVAAIFIHLVVGFYEYALGRIYHSSVKATRIMGPREQPPPPRLQTSPAQDWEDYRRVAEAQLHSYGWVDRDTGIIRLPIERAMELTVQRGLPARAQPRKEPAP